MANILIKQGKEIAGSSLVTPSTKADKTDLSSIIQTGTASSQAISAGTYFYLNDTLVRAKVDIANGATFTLNTNYEVVTAGALNEKGLLDTDNAVNLTSILSSNGSTYTVPRNGKVYVNTDYTGSTDASPDIYYMLNTTKLGTVHMFRQPRAYQGVTSNFDAISGDIISAGLSDSTGLIRVFSIKFIPYK